MRNDNGRLVGILGTVIMHLVAAIIFMSFQISSLQKYRPEVFAIEVATAEESATRDKIIELPSASEKILQNEEKMVNIARNLANTEKGDKKINPADYVDNVKDELIKSGKLGADNFIDEAKRMQVNKGDENLSIEKDSSRMKAIEKTKEAQTKPSNFKGPTRIYYDLMGRTHSYLPIPIYMCQGSGKVVLSIEVDQKGVVEKAEIISAESTASDPCLVETAINTALISRFSPDVNSPKIQAGTLTYIFVAQ